MKRDLYTDHFNFSERPFSLLPDPEFLFWSQAHARAFSVLEYGLMTRAPLTIGPDALAEEAVAIMNDRKITCLFVIPETGPQRPAGFLHIHDCLRAGIG